LPPDLRPFGECPFQGGTSSFPLCCGKYVHIVIVGVLGKASVLLFV